MLMNCHFPSMPNNIIFGMLSTECFCKMQQYINSILATQDHTYKMRLVGLAFDYMIRCKELGESFQQMVYNHLHDSLCTRKDYTLLLLLDQLIRQFKYFKRLVKDDAEKLFLNVFSECWKDKNGKAVRDLKIVWKVWTLIFGNKIKNIKANIYNKHKCEVDKLNQEDEIALKMLTRSIDPTSHVQSKQSSILATLQSDSDDSL